MHFFCIPLRQLGTNAQCLPIKDMLLWWSTITPEWQRGSIVAENRREGEIGLISPPFNDYSRFVFSFSFVHSFVRSQCCNSFVDINQFHILSLTVAIGRLQSALSVVAPGTFLCFIRVWQPLPFTCGFHRTVANACTRMKGMGVRLRQTYDCEPPQGNNT